MAEQESMDDEMMSHLQSVPVGQQTEIVMHLQCSLPLEHPHIYTRHKEIDERVPSATH